MKWLTPVAAICLSLKGVAFEWNSRFLLGSILDWQAMKATFVDHFYTTRLCVSLKELSDINQERDEPIMNFINRWRALSLHCSQEMMQEEAVKLYTSGLHPWIQLQIRGVTPNIFDHLSTVVTYLELYYRQ